MNALMFCGGAEGLRSEDLAGFFVGWPHPPALDDRLEILRSADEVVVCRSSEGDVIGFATAITDYRFAAYIPLVEVLPDYQRRGVGSQMVTTLRERLRACYMDRPRVRRRCRAVLRAPRRHPAQRRRVEEPRSPRNPRRLTE